VDFPAVHDLGSKYKIAYFLNVMSYGGSEVYTRIISNELQKMDHKITIFAKLGKAVNELQELKIDFYPAKFFGIKANSIREINYSNSLKTMLARMLLKNYKVSFKIFYWKLERNFRRGNYNLIICQQPLPSILAAFLSKEYKVPIINVVHHIIPNEYSDIYKELGVDFDHYIAISNEIRNFLIGQKLIPQDKISVVMNPFYVYPEVIKKNLEEERKKTHKKIVLISHIHKDKWKSVEDFVRSALYIKKDVIHNIEFNIYGDIADGVKVQFYKLIDEINNGLHSKKILYKGLSRNIDEVIDRSSVIVGMARSAIEAATRGKIVIISGHFVGEKGGNYGGILNLENFSELSYNNFSGRNSKIKANPLVLAEDIERTLDILKSDDYEKFIMQLTKKINAELGAGVIITKLMKIIKGILQK